MESLQQIEPREKSVPARAALPEENSQKFAIMDLLDEELIREELAGVNVDELVYEFPLGGKTVTGLTVYGTLTMGRLAVDMMPNIEITCDEPKVEKRENGFKATCRVTYRNLKTGSSISFPGTKFQSKDITNKEGKVVKENDPNAETIAEMKAMRNGLLKIFPPKKSAEFLNQFRSEGKIKRLSKDETEEALAKAKRMGGGPAKVAEKGSEEKTSTQHKAEDPSSAEFYLSKLNWFTKEGIKSRQWKPGDNWGWCFSEDTEILTIEGWKPFRSLDFGTKLATRRGDGVVEYHVPVALQSFHYDGEMIHFGGRKSPIDLLVTPEHRMLVRDTRREGKPEQIMLAQEIEQCCANYAPSSVFPFLFVRSAQWIGEHEESFDIPATIHEMKISEWIEAHRMVMSSNGETSVALLAKQSGMSPGTIKSWLSGDTDPSRSLDSVRSSSTVTMNNWLNFFGWYLSEGSTSGTHRTIIYQKKEKNFEIIKEAISGLGLSSSYHNKSNAFRIPSSRLTQYLKRFGVAEKKFIPNEIKKLDGAQLRILLNSMILGDGSTRGKCSAYTTTSKQLAGDVQEIAIKAGYSAIMITYRETTREFGFPSGSGNPRRNSLSQCLPHYVVSMTPQRDSRTGYVEREHYFGTVYDVTVPNHTILVRRNGKACWTGNCNASLFNGEGIVEYAQPIVDAIQSDDESKGSVEVGSEEITFDPEKGRLYRKKAGTTIPLIG